MLANHMSATPRGAAGIVMAATLCVALLFSTVAQSASAGDGVQRLNSYLSGLTSLKSDFEQVTFNADRTNMMQARGTFYLQRPGRFRWEYDTPNKQVILADGDRVYVHDLDLKQVSHQSQAKALRGTPALLLVDGGPISKHFTAKSVDSSDGRDWVELRPKAKDTDIVKIELGFGSKELESIIMEDSFGQMTRLDFSAIRRNPRLDLGLFEMEQSNVDEFLSLD